MRALSYGLLVWVATGCRPDPALRVERIGNYAVTPFAIVQGDVLADDGSAVQRLGPDGTVKWRSNARGEWAIPRGGVGSAFVVAESDSVDKAPLLEVDLATGMSRLRSTVRPASYGKWYLVGDVLMLAEAGMIERINPDTGTELWMEGAGEGVPLTMVAEHELWGGGAYKLLGYSVVDGAKREMNGGTWASITPDGRTLVTEFGSDIAAFDMRSLQRTWTHVGDRHTVIASIAASDRWIAVQSQEQSGSRHMVTVYQRSDGKPVWSHRSAKGKFLGYIAAGGDLIAYYDSSDSSLHAVHMPDGKSAVVYRYEGGMYISTERAGIAPAVPDEPPMIDGDIMIVSDDPIKRAYRVTWKAEPEAIQQ